LFVVLEVLVSKVLILNSRIGEDRSFKKCLHFVSYGVRTT
jgi:hypothetical protein